MLPSSINEVQNAVSTHQEVIYITIGVLVGSIGLHYARKVNRINDGEPPLLPGALPVLGHALAFLKDNNKVYETARDWSLNSHPVSLSIAGKRLYVVLNPKDVSASWRAKTLNFDPICKWGLQALFAMTKEACEQLTTDPDGYGDMFENAHAFWRDALATGQAVNSLTMKFLRLLEVDFANVERDLRKTPNQEEIVSLRLWCRDHLGVPSTNAIMGPRLLANEPQVFEDLAIWEKNLFKLSMGFPKWMAKEGHVAREKLIRAFMKWGVDEEEMVHFLKKRTEMNAARGVDLWNLAAYNFLLWTATQVNINPTVFWLLYAIILHPKERAIIEREIAPAFSPSSSDPNVETLSDLDVLLHNAPLLNAMFWEALRYTGTSMSTREVTEDTIINGWKFEKGGMVMIPTRTNHQDPTTYGERIDEFVPDRFLNDFIKTDSSNGHPADGGSVGKPGPSIKSMKPFGGGSTLCPGRHFAGNEALAFVATALRRLDIQLVEGQKEAKPLTSVPAAGVYPPDHEVSVRIRLRK